MKKIFFLFTVVLFTALTSKAQKVILQDMHITLRDGANTIPLKTGTGTIRLVKRGNTFTDVVYADAAGNSTRLVPSKPGTGAAPSPSCNYPLPDACFGSTGGQAIGLCICKPTNLAADAYQVNLSLPAQNIRNSP